MQAPAPVAAGAQVLVRHEAIDDFVDASGKAAGMDAMVMPFEVAPPLTAKDLAVGDKVEIRFSMDWKGPRLLAPAAGHGAAGSRATKTFVPSLLANWSIQSSP